MAVMEIAQKLVTALSGKFPACKFEAVPFDGRFDQIFYSADVQETHWATYAFIERGTGKLYGTEGRSRPTETSRYDLSKERQFSLAIKKADKKVSSSYKSCHFGNCSKFVFSR